MACAAGNLVLKDFGREGIVNNEGVKVQLKEDGAKKMFVIPDKPYSLVSKEELV
jgi:hypothetical protein